MEETGAREEEETGAGAEGSSGSTQDMREGQSSDPDTDSPPPLIQVQVGPVSLFHHISNRCLTLLQEETSEGGEREEATPEGTSNGAEASKVDEQSKAEMAEELKDGIDAALRADQDASGDEDEDEGPAEEGKAAVCQEEAGQEAEEPGAAAHAKRRVSVSTEDEEDAAQGERGEALGPEGKGGHCSGGPGGGAGGEGGGVGGLPRGLPGGHRRAAPAPQPPRLRRLPGPPLSPQRESEPCAIVIMGGS